MMKNLFYLAILSLLFTSCEKHDFYLEGQVRTLSPQEITNHSATLHGNLKITFEGKDTDLKIIERGFVLTSTGSQDRKIYDNVSVRGNFSRMVANLIPNTKYQVQAFVTMEYNYDYWSGYMGGYRSKQQTFYGSTIEFTTKNEPVDADL